MTCQEAQGYVTPFINEELEGKQLEEFLQHIEICADCKEELEVYYILLTGMKQLDEDKNLPSNFHLAFINRLKKEEEHIIRKKIFYIRKHIILFVVVCSIALLSSIGIGEYVTEDMGEHEGQGIKQSDFMIKNYFYQNKATNLEFYIKDNWESILQYNIQLENKNKLINKGENDDK